MIVIQPNIIDNVEAIFDQAIIPGIAKLSLGERFPLGFVLIVYAIDYLASFNVGRETTGEDYINFLKEYEWFMDKYVPEDIYRSLRCGLVHNFTIKGGRYILASREPENHLKTKQFLGELMICLNFEDFLKDFKRLKDEYFAVVRRTKDKAQSFIKRFTEIGFLLPAGTD